MIVAEDERKKKKVHHTFHLSMIVVGTTATTATTAAEKKDFQGCRRSAEEPGEEVKLMEIQQLTDAEAEVEAEESASMCERILADLEAIFRREEANM